MVAVHLTVLLSLVAADPALTVDRLRLEARGALAEGNVDEADRLWRAAYEAALRAGIREPSLVTVKRMLRVSEEASAAFAGLGDAERAIRWTVTGPGGLRTANVDRLRSLAEIAKNNGHDARPYLKRIEAEVARRRARRAEAQAREATIRSRNSAGLLLAVTVTVALMLWLFAGALQTRLTTPARKRADLTKLTSLKIVGRDPTGRPTAWRTTKVGKAFDLLLLAMMRLSVIGALVGAYVFWPLLLDEVDEVPIAIMLGLLVCLFVAYALFVALADLTGPPRSVHREVELATDGLYVRTRRGIVAKRHYEDVLRWTDITAVQMHFLVTPVQHVTIKEYTVVVQTQIDGHERQMCVAGSADPEVVEEVGRAIADASGQPLIPQRE